MQDLLVDLTDADYLFLVRIIEGGAHLSDTRALREALAAFEAAPSDAARRALCAEIEEHVRYLGSADLAYFLRKTTGRTPGAPFREIVGDVARVLKTPLEPGLTDREAVRRLVQRYTTRTFGSMSAQEQQDLLVELGVDRERALAFLAKSAGAFALPALIQAFGMIVVDGLIKRVIFGAIARFVGRRVAGELFRLAAGRFPWWLRWIGPAAWSLSAGWVLLDLQGPAVRKTAPIVLYLGVCALREDGATA